MRKQLIQQFLLRMHRLMQLWDLAVKATVHLPLQAVQVKALHAQAHSPREDAA